MKANGPGKPVLVYLADLSHTGIRVATEAFPLNIGLIAAYNRKRFGRAIEFRLFKYPAKLLEAIKREPPHILGCSNYTWNSNLSTFATEYVKQIDRRIVTVFGGTNYPFDAAGQEEFLAAHPSVDVHVFYEGEIAFGNLLQRYLEANRLSAMFDASIDGCQFLHPESRELVSGVLIERIKDLDTIPSPYISGLLDEFFDGLLTPLMETARGCPFRCNFCNAGNGYFNRIHKFSIDYVREEVAYIAPRAAARGITHLTLVDNNFGMIPRDGEIAEIFARAHEQYRWPLQMSAWTGKNSKERVIKATEILGPVLSISMAVQSMTDQVLINIERDNISLNAYKAINEALTRQGRPQGAELIVPLPGETLTSFLEGVRKLMDCEVRTITSHTLQLLYGTPYKNPDYRQRFGYRGYWRVVPLDFGIYEGKPIFDTEEVAVSCNTLPFEDYLKIRTFTLIIELCYNDHTFFELIQYLKGNRISLFEWTSALWQGIDDVPSAVRQVFHDFLEETKSELWNSREELEAYYSHAENYQKLIDGTRGGNVLFKHKGLIFVLYMELWVDYIFSVSRRILAAADPNWVERESELRAIRRYVSNKLRGVLGPDGPRTEDVTEAFEYDLLAWLADGSGAPLSAFRVQGYKKYRFFFSDLQRYERKDAAARYGTDCLGLVKTLQRAASLRRLFRQIEACS